MDELDDLFDEASVVSTDSDTEDWLIIDHDFRTIDIPSTKQLGGVTSDENVNVLHFQCPRYYGDSDLMDFNFRINYTNANNEGDQYLVMDTESEGDIITFSWTVGRHACEYVGNIRFIVCAILAEDGDVEKEYNTAIHTLQVVEGLETSEEVYEAVHDVIEEFQEYIDRAADIDQYIATAITCASDSEAYAAGTRDGVAVTSDDPAYHNNTSYYYDLVAPLAASTQTNATSVHNLMLTGMVEVEDLVSTSVTLAAEKETRYIYGELTALTVSSLPATGIVDICFESGDTATVVTLPTGTVMPEWYAVAANTKYELNFEDGYGVVMSWPIPTV